MPFGEQQGDSAPVGTPGTSSEGASGAPAAGSAGGGDVALGGNAGGGHRPPLAPPALTPPPRASGAGGPGRGGGGSGGGGWKWLALGLLVVLGVGLVVGLGGVVLGWASLQGPVAAVAAGEGHFEEVLVENRQASAKVAVVDVDGVIFGGYLEPGGMSVVDRVRQQLKRVERDGAVKAVVLRVNSPGGEVLAADELARLLREFQQRSRKPVVAALSGLAASGGYYIAAPCRWIVAHELTLTGSIGVIMRGYNYRGLMDKVGVRPQVYKSGRFKDMLSPDRAPGEIPEEERAMLESLIGEAFDRFKQTIADGRSAAAEQNGDKGRALVEGWERFADGRVLSGRQAFEAGLVDELGGLDVAVERAQGLAGVPRANLIRYQEPFTLGKWFRLLGESRSQTVRVDLDLGLDLPRLKVGLPYFLFLPEVP